LPSITAEEVVNLFEADARARRRLAELLVSEPDVRLAIINAVLRDVATKDDIEALKNATKSDIEALRREVKGDVESLRREFKSDIESLRGELGKLDGRVGALEQRVARLEGSISLFAKLFIAFNLPLLVSVIVALVMMLLRAR
jgi:polyhydroxyalkanoate synthesis regulator phasin